MDSGAPPVLEVRDWTLPLLVFGGLLVTNVVVSLLLYWNDRTPLHRLLALFFLGMMVGICAQGAVPAPPATIVAFGVPIYLVNLCLADFLSRALSLHGHWRAWVVTAAVCTVASVVLFAASAPFWAISLPVAIAVTAPLFDITWQALRGPQKLSVIARCMLGAVILMALHDLDYPFLRNEPSFIPYGFAIAITTLFALSITAPALVLERTAAEVRRLQAEALERERFSALGEASAVVAHEVRNPLGTMTNTIELLRKEPALSAEGRELLTIQATEVLRLDRLVRDLLCFSKPLEPRLVDVEVTGLVRDAVRSLRADAVAAGVELAVDESSERFVRGDADSIHIALVNVLHNAIQASPGGGTVRVGLANGGDDVRVLVDDEGDGIAADALDHVFKPFFTTRATGSGLGLAILDRIMKAHGGQVRVTNLPGKGARFELVFVTAPR